MAFGLGMGLSNRLNNGSSGGSPTRGPELAGAPFTSWTFTGTGVVIDATGVTYNNAQTAQANLNIVTEDNVTYEVIFTISDYVSGNGVIRVYGATATHTGVGATISAAGTYTQQVTTNGAGSPVLQVRLTPNLGATYKLTAISVKKVLG